MHKTTLGLAIASILLTPISYAESTITDAITSGKAQLNLRLRYEDVDQGQPIDKTADALTLKTRLNYQTANFKGFSAMLEMDDVSALDSDDYNSTTNGITNKAVIADPEGTDVNQIWIKYNNWDTEFKWGRQRITLDNQRFVGGVGFRQNEQTYDGFSITNKSVQDTTIFAANINNVNRIFGENSANGDHNSNNNLINIQYAGLSAGTITGYAYLLDNKDFSRFSTDTVGVRFIGKNGDLSYTLEYATQQDSNNNTLSYDADYILLEAGYQLDAINLKLGYEVLGSDNGNAAFITPLATLHAFQGWTDQFLSTPNEGINDLYFSIATTLNTIKLTAIIHQFNADQSNSLDDDDLGSEWGLLAAKNIGHYGLSIKYASYSAGDSSFGKSDTDKLWLTASAKF